MVMIFDAIVYFIAYIIFYFFYFRSVFLSLCCLSFVGVNFRWFGKTSRLFCVWVESETTTIIKSITHKYCICITHSLQREQTSSVISMVFALGSLYLQWFAAFEKRIDLFINSYTFNTKFPLKYSNQIESNRQMHTIFVVQWVFNVY